MASAKKTDVCERQYEMTFSTIVRTDMAGVAASFRANKLVKVFRHPEGWSVKCPEGLLVDSGTEKFGALETDSKKSKQMEFSKPCREARKSLWTKC